ncbi:zinc-ribbon domain-containing protein [Actinoplanes campanulatus]|nr:zinc-ribbon domain-containing protein [Actinoplanes capillaceus]
MSTGESGNPPSIDESVVAAYHAGQPISEIADQYQISSDTVQEIVNKATTAPPANFCSACGTALPAAAGFCPQCGNPVAAVPGTTATMARPTVERPVAIWVVLAAGVVAILGSFLPWVVLSAPFIGTISKSGVDGSDGWVSVVLGALITGYAAVRLRPMHLPGAVTVVAGLVAALLFVFGIIKFIDLRLKADEAKSMMRGRDDPFGIGAALSDRVQITPGVGLWLVTAAGLVGATAALLSAIGGRGGSLGKAVGAAALVPVAVGLAATVLMNGDQDPATGPNAVTAASAPNGMVAPAATT